MVSFHDPIPNIRQHVCEALLAQEYWCRGELVDEANVLFLRLDDGSWHRFFIDAGVVFWKTVEAPELPREEGEHSYRINDVGSLHRLAGKRLTAIDAVDSLSGVAIRLAFEGGEKLILDNRNDRSRLIVEHECDRQRDG